MHTNSGVQNHWFYLLSEGGNGVNDDGFYYSVNGIGIEHLRAEYGGKRDRGSKPYKARAGSGAITRKALQQLEKAGFVTRVKGKGRIITPKGRSFVDNTSHEVIKNVKDYYPGLEKY